MAIKEPSFRIGSGRYLQEEGIISRVGEESLALGAGALIIGGKTALSITEGSIRESLDAVSNRYEIITHIGPCSREAAERYSKVADEKALSVIIGVGGGVIMDLSKLVASIGGRRIMTVPTSSATCAAVTPLSVVYTEDGRTVGTTHFLREVDTVLVDTDILRRQPKRLLVSGVLDALAKLPEIEKRYKKGTPPGKAPLGLSYARTLAEDTEALLSGYTETALSDMSADRVTPILDEIIFAAISVTGVISGIARGSNQCAIAHKFYEMTRLMYPKESKAYLHGEIVGVGLLLQNHFSGREELNPALIALMERNCIPTSPKALGIPDREGVMEEYFEKIKNSSAIEKASVSETDKLKAALEYLWRRN